MKTNKEIKTPDPRRHATYDPRERIRNVAGNEPGPREEDVYQAKAQTALAGSTQNSGGRSGS